ncbi:hypothetical protein HMPREF9120_02116 [Neisseria sp. oral taxon 020 str. F0370]|nr:hypothetical protein HMPREF9120_02116 [Neisseria sp. oral taxon 020 str. F0370]
MCGYRNFYGLQRQKQFCELPPPPRPSPALRRRRGSKCTRDFWFQTASKCSGQEKRIPARL